VLIECIAAAKAALAETINQNPVLKKQASSTRAARAM
jgi:hypothetical protein